MECLVEQMIIEMDNSSEASSCSQEKCRRASNLSLEQSGIVRCPSGFGPLRIGPPGPNPFAKVDPRGSTFASGFGPPVKTYATK